MSLQDLAADDTQLTPERPSQRSLDPTQPTAEEQAARAREAGPQPVPPQQGPGIALPRLSQTNPAQVAMLNPAIPQTGRTEEPVEDATRNASKDANAAADYNLNPPAIYRPPAPTRDPTQLGDDWFPTKAAQSYPGLAPGPDMPSPQESYNVAADASSRMGKWGPGPIADSYNQANLLMSPLAAVADAFSKGRFSQNFSVANLRGLQIQRYEAAAALEKAVEQHGEFLRGANVIAKSEAAGLLTADQARDEMQRYLIANGAQNLEPVLRDHGIKGVYKLLQIQDAEWRKAHSSLVTQQKTLNTEGNDETLRSWGFTGTGDIDTAGMSGGRLDHEATKAAPEARGPPMEGELAVFNNLPEQGKDAAHAIFNGRPPAGLADLGKSGPGGANAVDKINQMARALDSRANKIAQYQNPKADPDELSQQKLDALRRTDPEYASVIEGLKNLTIDPNDERAVGNARVHAIAQTQQIFPGWNRDAYHQFHQVWNNAQSKESQQLQAANRATTSVIPFEKAVNGLPISETAAWPARVWAEIKTKGFTSDPAYAALNEPLRTLATEVVFASGGRSQVTAVQQFLREAPLTGSKASLRTLARQSMIGLKGIVDQQTNTFHKTTGLSGRPPAFDERSDQIMDALVRSNPYTGAFPKDAPVELRSVEPKAAQRNQRLTPDKSWEPLTREDYDKRKRYIEKNPHDPLIQLYIDELGILQ
jgi:hypothetical protein